MLVKEIMTEEVVSVRHDEKVTKVATLLFDNNLTGAPVVDDNDQLIGIVTEYDFISPAA